MDIEIESLRRFVYIALYGNLSFAAKELNMTQPALSRLIGNLEKTLGAQLFERKAKSMELTSEGEIVLEAACKICNSYNQMAADLKQDKIRHGDKVITIAGLLETSVFDRIYRAKKALALSHPEITVKTKAIDLAIPFNALRDGVVDIVFEVYSDVLEIREISSVPIVKEQAYLVTDRTNSIAQKDSLAIEDIRELTLLSINSNIDYSLRRHVQSICKRRDFVPLQVVRQSTSQSDLLLTDLTDAGVLLPETIARSVVKPHYEDLCIIPIEDEDSYYDIRAFYSSILPYQPTEFIEELAKTG